MKTVIKINRPQVETAIRLSVCPSEAIMACYYAVYTEEMFARIKEVRDYPKCNTATATWIMGALREKFPMTDPSSILSSPGVALWFNKGFSTRGAEHLERDEVELSPVELTDGTFMYAEESLPAPESCLA